MHIIKWEHANTGYEIDYTHSARIALSETTEILIDKLDDGRFRLQVIYQTPCEHGPGVECSTIGEMTIEPGHSPSNRNNDGHAAPHAAQ